MPSKHAVAFPKINIRFAHTGVPGIPFHITYIPELAMWLPNLLMPPK